MSLLRRATILLALGAAMHAAADYTVVRRIPMPAPRIDVHDQAGHLLASTTLQWDGGTYNATTTVVRTGRAHYARVTNPGNPPITRIVLIPSGGVTCSPSCNLVKGTGVAVTNVGAP